jgi:hypothetical protein
MWLLIAALIPLRGAMAAAMLCPTAGAGLQSEVRIGGQPMGHHAMTDAAAAAQGHAQHDHAHHDHADGAHDHGGGGHDKCNLCSAFCSVTPMVGAAPTLPAPDLANASFPALAAPAASFLSSGQERPPRSI